MPSKENIDKLMQILKKYLPTAREESGKIFLTDVSGTSDDIDFGHRVLRNTGVSFETKDTQKDGPHIKITCDDATLEKAFANLDSECQKADVVRQEKKAKAEALKVAKKGPGKVASAFQKSDEGEKAKAALAKDPEMQQLTQQVAELEKPLRQIRETRNLLLKEIERLNTAKETTEGLLESGYKENIVTNNKKILGLQNEITDVFTKLSDASKPKRSSPDTSADETASASLPPDAPDAPLMGAPDAPPFDAPPLDAPDAPPMAPPIGAPGAPSPSPVPGPVKQGGIQAQILGNPQSGLRSVAKEVKPAHIPKDVDLRNVLGKGPKRIDQDKPKEDPKEQLRKKIKSLEKNIQDETASLERVKKQVLRVDGELQNVNAKYAVMKDHIAEQEKLIEFLKVKKGKLDDAVGKYEEIKLKKEQQIAAKAAAAAEQNQDNSAPDAPPMAPPLEDPPDAPALDGPPDAPPMGVPTGSLPKTGDASKKPAVTAPEPDIDPASLKTTIPKKDLDIILQNILDMNSFHHENLMKSFGKEDEDKVRKLISEYKKIKNKADNTSDISRIQKELTKAVIINTKKIEQNYQKGLFKQANMFSAIVKDILNAKSFHHDSIMNSFSDADKEKINKFILDYKEVEKRIASGEGSKRENEDALIAIRKDLASFVSGNSKVMFNYQESLKKEEMMQKPKEVKVSAEIVTPKMEIEKAEKQKVNEILGGRPVLTVLDTENEKKKMGEFQREGSGIKAKLDEELSDTNLDKLIKNLQIAEGIEPDKPSTDTPTTGADTAAIPETAVAAGERAPVLDSQSESVAPAVGGKTNAESVASVAATAKPAQKLPDMQPVGIKPADATPAGTKPVGPTLPGTKPEDAATDADIKTALETASVDVAAAQPATEQTQPKPAAAIPRYKDSVDTNQVAKTVEDLDKLLEGRSVQVVQKKTDAVPTLHARVTCGNVFIRNALQKALYDIKIPPFQEGSKKGNAQHTEYFVMIPHYLCNAVSDNIDDLETNFKKRLSELSQSELDFVEKLLQNGKDPYTVLDVDKDDPDFNDIINLMSVAQTQQKQPVKSEELYACQMLSIPEKRKAIDEYIAKRALKADNVTSIAAAQPVAANATPSAPTASSVATAVASEKPKDEGKPPESGQPASAAPPDAGPDTSPKPAAGEPKAGPKVVVKVPEKDASPSTDIKREAEQVVVSQSAEDVQTKIKAPDLVKSQLVTTNVAAAQAQPATTNLAATQPLPAAAQPLPAAPQPDPAAAQPKPGGAAVDASKSPPAAPAVTDLNLGKPKPVSTKARPAIAPNTFEPPTESSVDEPSPTSPAAAGVPSPVVPGTPSSATSGAASPTVPVTAPAVNVGAGHVAPVTAIPVTAAAPPKPASQIIVSKRKDKKTLAAESAARMEAARQAAASTRGAKPPDQAAAVPDAPTLTASTGVRPGANAGAAAASQPALLTALQNREPDSTLLASGPGDPATATPGFNAQKSADSLPGGVAATATHANITKQNVEASYAEILKNTNPDDPTRVALYKSTNATLDQQPPPTAVDFKMSMNYPDGKQDKISRTVDLEKKTMRVSLSRNAQDETFQLFCKINSKLGPLKMKPCNDAKIAMKILEASIREGSPKVILNPSDIELINKSEFKSLYDLLQQPDASEAYKNLGPRKLGEPLKLPTPAQDQDMVFEGTSPRTPNKPSGS